VVQPLPQQRADRRRRRQRVLVPDDVPVRGHTDVGLRPTLRRLFAVVVVCAVIAPACSRGDHASAPGQLQARVETAQGFLQKVRETGDPTYYRKVAGLLPKDSDDPQVLITLGTLALAQHRFTDGRRLGQKAVKVAPSLSEA